MTFILMRMYFSFLKRDILLSLSFLVFCAISSAQENPEFRIPDSLQSKTFEALKSSFLSLHKDSPQRKLYANTYLAKATIKKDVLQMAIGNELLGIAHTTDYEKRFLFYDKAIALSKDLKHKRYPAILFTRKGATYYLKGNYKEALENYLKAIEYAETHDNIKLLYVNKHNIGILKKRLELYDEALQIFKECYLYELNNPERDAVDFMYSHFSLADIYTDIKVLDSAIKYNTKGFKLALKKNNDFAKMLFSLNKGIIAFHQKEYEAAITQLKTSVTGLSQTSNKLPIISGLFYIGKALDSLDQNLEAISYYKKVDSVFTAHPNHISSNVMESYEALYTYFKINNDKVNEAYYIEKALLASDISENDYRTLSTKIAKNFDRRELLRKQKKLNTALIQKDEKYANTLTIAILILVILILIFILFYIRQQRQIRKRFEEFVENHEKTIQTPPTVANEEAKAIGVAEEVIDKLLTSLHDFETKHIYIESDITLPSLAKRFKTNSAYLSKVINTYKNKKFAEYLNDLRIDYAIEKIQTEKYFRLYTIKAIALEVGFNNSQSFARAFKRKTKIQPSDFIKQITITKVAKAS